ncbi:thioesterase II family protein [Streptomyces diastatochromogenes]|uniref:Oleoyl-ACP hydrolase n=1 Tax=Streptomyces diastatochromogenes TaxID=42236 RepID=A0A233S7G2_STRDA|nr:alpha/beta fold hydrolase [Streptomyces diastatochromogenes]MCZ0990634.1 alpha/beta fold hydrolase [Streptomyces diastatochromogenes]OXY91605.1 oleoyl-ACP hydrolase [Streptomyces diastatochromogenes]
MQVSTEEQSSWTRRFIEPVDSELRLVCFPHAGGSAAYFRPLAQSLAPRVEALCVQYPGRQDRRHEPLLDSVPALADAAFAALRPTLDGPFAFFGHSLGALVAFEVARRFEQLTAQGPVRLFASARRAPSVARDERVHLRDDAGLIAELTRLGGTADALLTDDDLRALVLPAVRADYRAAETYTAVPANARLTCPISVFVGDADPVALVPEARAWEAHTTGSTDLRVFTGGHFYLDGNTAAVARAVLDTL